MAKEKFPCFSCGHELIDENYSSLDNLEEKYRKYKPQYAHIVYLPVSEYDNPYITNVGKYRHKYIHAECFFNMIDDKTLELFDRLQEQKFINQKFLTCSVCSQYTKDIKHSHQDEIRISLFCKENDSVNNSLTFHAKCFSEKLGISIGQLKAKFLEKETT